MELHIYILATKLKVILHAQNTKKLEPFVTVEICLLNYYLVYFFIITITHINNKNIV